MQILNYITSYIYNKITAITKSPQKPNKTSNQDTNTPKNIQKNH
jgi:hypothetical protein